MRKLEKKRGRLVTEMDTLAFGLRGQVAMADGEDEDNIDKSETLIKVRQRDRGLRRI